MITTGPIEAFFKPPTDSSSETGDCLLYHLRSDLESLYGRETSTSSVSPSHTLLATMGVLSGIDYLSQVYSTEAGSHKRFIETMQGLADFSVDDSEALYQLRCAVVHQIGLSNISESSYRRGTRFIFEITDVAHKPVIQKHSDSGNEVNYSVGFWELKRCFIEIVNRLRGVCETATHSRNAHAINKVGHMHLEKLLKQ